MTELSETLACGGTLRVDANDWEINYYLPGPDRRYKGRFFSVTRTLSSRYLAAIQGNFLEYEKLHALFSNEEAFCKELEFGMSIRISKNDRVPSGLYLGSHKQPLSTRFQLEKLIETYSAAFEKARKTQARLRSLG